MQAKIQYSVPACELKKLPDMVVKRIQESDDRQLNRAPVTGAENGNMFEMQRGEKRHTHTKNKK